tara:strand:- start:67 stop:264 length:198 start_codon:yes stop_codon:yes gene_type:complete
VGEAVGDAVGLRVGAVGDIVGDTVGEVGETVGDTEEGSEQDIASPNVRLGKKKSISSDTVKLAMV